MSRLGRMLCLGVALFTPLVVFCGSENSGITPVRTAVSQDRPMFIVDTDLAFWGDDSNSILMLLRSQAVNIVGITGAAGNVWEEQATANTLRLLETVGHADIPMHAGVPSSVHESRLRYYWEVESEHWAKGVYSGALGLGRSIVPVEEPPGGWAHSKPQPPSAPDFMIEQILAHPGKINLLLLGPPTNLAAALKKEPKIAALIAHVYVFGGAFKVAGNTTAAAEFNFWFDPESSDAILRADLPMTLLPLDACHDSFFSERYIEEFARAGDPLAQHVSEMIKRRLQTHPGLPVPMWDEMLVATIISPAMATETKCQKVRVVVDHGPEYGASRIVEDKSSRREVCIIYRVDNEALHSLIRNLFGNRVSP